MNRLTTHFTPPVPRPPRGRDTGVPAMISVTAMAGVSAMVRHAFGDKVLRHAKQAAMLDIELIEDQECFIPQATMTGFLAEVERRACEPHLGALVAPHLSLARFGLWGQYLLAADTLGAALARAVRTLGCHCTGDRVTLSADRGLVRVSYVNASRGQPGYVHVASGTAGVLLSLFSFYLPPDWRPHGVELDIPRPREVALFEDAFGCPVVFDAPAVTVCFDQQLLERPALPRERSRLLTPEDVARARQGPPRLDRFLDAVVAQVHSQVLSGAVSIDRTAQALGTSVRSLQRALRHDGTDFRQLVGAVRVRRAKELLGSSTASITEIATGFGYSTPANFARAFRKETGLAPQEFRERRGMVTPGAAK